MNEAEICVWGNGKSHPHAARRSRLKKTVDRASPSRSILSIHGNEASTGDKSSGVSRTIFPDVTSLAMCAGKDVDTEI